MPRTQEELAEEVLSAYHAVNLSGVVTSFAKALSDLRPHVSGNLELHRHPVTLMWVDIVATLAGHKVDDQQTQCDSYEKCVRLRRIGQQRKADQNSASTEELEAASVLLDSLSKG